MKSARRLKQVTVTDVRYHFPKVERMLRLGKPLEVTRRNRVFALIVPAAKPNRST